METKKRRNALIITIAVSAALVIVIITAGFIAKNKTYEPSQWIIRSYGNSVALYNGNKLDTVFGEVVLDTLTEEDLKLLKKGISFPTKEEAMHAVEDYDG